MGTHTVAQIQRHRAYIFFCSSRDPCSCSGGPYLKYEPLCSFLAETNVTKPRDYDLNGYPGLGAEFITEFSNNGTGTVGLDLNAFRTRHKSPIEYVPAGIREALLTGFLVCIAIVTMMYAMMLLLEGAGMDEAAKKEMRKKKASAELQEMRKSLGIASTSSELVAVSKQDSEEGNDARGAKTSKKTE